MVSRKVHATAETAIKGNKRDHRSKGGVLTLTGGSVGFGGNDGVLCEGLQQDGFGDGKEVRRVEVDGDGLLLDASMRVGAKLSGNEEGATVPKVDTAMDNPKHNNSMVLSFFVFALTLLFCRRSMPHPSCWALRTAILPMRRKIRCV